MVKRRAKEAGIKAEISPHSFRATGITAYLENGGTIEHAQRIAAHESPRTTKLYDRTNEQLTLAMLAAQMAQMMTEFREFRAFAEPKLYDTKPIWERALAGIVELRQEMNERLARLEKEMRQLNRKFDEVGRDQYTLCADVCDLEDRISGLENRG